MDRRKREKEKLRKRKERQSTACISLQSKSNEHTTLLQQDIDTERTDVANDDTCSAVLPHQINIDVGVHEYSFTNITPDEVLHGELDIQIMDYISQLLKIQYHCQYGMLPPTYVYSISSERRAGPHHKIPVNADAIQMHFITGHYLLSARKQGKLYVYDSMPHTNHIESVKSQLQVLYEHFSIHDIECITPQHQGSTLLCGLFVIANAISLLKNIDPNTIHFHTEEMRSHLHKCLQEGVLSDFPHSTKSGTTNTPGSQLLQKYFMDQKQKTIAKRSICELHAAKPKSVPQNKTNQNPQILHYRQTRNERRNITRNIKRKDQRYRKAENLKRKQTRTLQRSDSEYKKKENIKRKQTRALQRSDSEYKKKENIKCKQTRALQRSDSEYKKKENIKRKQTRALQRSDSEYRKKENIKRKQTRTFQRSKLDYKRKENIKCKQTRTLQRSDSEYRKKENIKHQQTRTLQRSKLEYKRKENIKCRQTRTLQRSDSEYKKKENIKRKQTRTLQRCDSEYKKKENIKRQQTRTLQRSDSEYRKKENIKRQQTRTLQRSKLEYKRKENIKCKQTRTLQRSDSEYRKKENIKRQQTRTLQRCDSQYKKKENLKRKITRTCLRNQEIYATEEKESKRLRLERSRGVDINTLIQNFHKIVSNGPVFVCCLCRQLWYRHSVVKTKSAFKGMSLENVLKDVSKKYKNVNCTSLPTEPFICKTCVSHLKRKKIPPSSTLNKMTLPEQGPLKNLNVLEQLLLAPIIPFLRIHQANVGKQYLIQGNIVLVPSDVKNTVSALPRLSTNTATIKARLKRRLRYKNHLYNMNIRPEILRESLAYLSTSSKLYKDHNIYLDENFPDSDVLPEVNVDDNQTEATHTSDNGSCYGEEIHNSFCNNSEALQVPKPSMSNQTGTTPNSETSPSQDDYDSDEAWSECDPSELILPDNPGIQDTLLTAPDFVEPSEKDFVYNFAPAEGKQPVSVFLEQNAEELSFPSIFGGQARPSNKERALPVTYSEIVKSELRNEDRRAALSIENLFFKTKKLQMKQLLDLTQIAIRKSKTKGQVLTAKDVKGDSPKHFIYQDKAFKFMASIRGSPSYFQAVSKDLFAMIRQLGPATFFCSLSAAETRWTHLLCILSEIVDKKPCTEEKASHFDWTTKCRLIQSDPITCARHFDFAVNKFFKNFLLMNANPISKIKDFFYRVEYQQRGSPHVHMLIWCENSPKYGQDSDKDIIAFIDSYISCELPSDDNTELQNLVALETHRHTHTCKKKGKKQCRFGFPKPPLDTTMILEPLSEECEDKQHKSVHIKNWNKIQDHLKEIHTMEKSLPFEQFLKSLSLSKEEYIYALRSSIRTTTVFLKRATTETRINSYNPPCLRAWRANMDLQFVIDVYACASYIAAYVTKSHRGMSELLRNAASEARKGNYELKQQVRTIGNKFLNAIEISAQEASYICLELPMRKSSRKVIFINTSPPCERVSLLKPSDQLEKLDDDDEDIECSNILTRYANRPNSMENISLANFAANYNQRKRYTVQRTKSSTMHSIDGLLPEQNDSDNDDTLSDNESTTIQYSKAKKTRIIRYVHFNPDVQEENFFREQLMLFSPWRNEQTDILAGYQSFKKRFQQVKNNILKEKMEYEPYREQVDLAEKVLATEPDMQDAWDQVAPVTEHTDGISNETHLPHNAEDNYDLGPDLGIQVTSYEEDLAKTYELPDNQYREHMRSLNKEQMEFVYDTIHEIKTSNKPVYRFLSGGAGVGKSFVTKALYQMALKYYNSFAGKDFSSSTVQMMAPTGKAAHHIHGSTIHTAMKIPANQNLKHHPLPSSALNTFRNQLGDVKLIFIDEISMVGFNMFNYIHLRLQELKQSKEDFGGVSIIAIGDLFQLKPVMDSYIFLPPNNAYLPLANILWNVHFTMLELQQIMRQKESKEFACLLNRLREGQHTSSDTESLQSCIVDQQQLDYPHNVQHLFTTNEKVDAHNFSALHHTNQKVHEIKAQDRVVGSCHEDLEKKILSSFINNAHSSRQLPTVLHLVEGFPYDLTVNLDTDDGLTNGASCTLMKIDLVHNCVSGILWVKFQDLSIGQSLRSTCKQRKDYDASWTPISPVCRQFQAGYKGQAQVERRQYPLRPAAAKTVHRAQGDTMDKVVVDMTTNHKIDHIHYVALSRVTTKEGLYILNLQHDKISVNKHVEKEMKRLRDSHFQPSLQFLYNVQSTCKIAFLNARSLHRHIEDIRNDYSLMSCHLFACCETRYIQSDTATSSSICGFQQYRQDSHSQGNARPPHGIVLYSKSPFTDPYPMNISHLPIEIILTQILSINVVFLYRPPSSSIRTLETTLTNVHHQYLQNSQAIIIGDFNVDFSKKCTNQQRLMAVTSKLGYQQLVTKPTTDIGSTIDLVFCNFNMDMLRTGVLETFFSDHKIIWITL